MRKWSVLISATALFMSLILGCSGGGDPLAPNLDTPIPDNTLKSVSMSGSATNLWGYYTVSIDPVTSEINVALNRSAMFTANVTHHINLASNALMFQIETIDEQADYYDFELIVAITHPFPGLPKFHGYDVRGVFMGNGSASMMYNSDLQYPIVNTDPSFVTNLDPDGYTRWFNPSEFPEENGMPLFTYTPGNFAYPGFDGSATLCPYKYFADSLGDDENLADWLEANLDRFGQFSSGATNARNYKVRFPKPLPLEFGYAIIANWDGPDDDDHPGNAPEAVGCRVDQGGDIYYHSPSAWGGEIDVRLDIFAWDTAPVSGSMGEYSIYFESDALSSVYQFTPDDMTPADSGENWHQYSARFPADNLESSVGNEFWVIVQSQLYDYTNEFGIPNDAWDDPLAAFFRYDLDVSSINPTEVPVCDIQINECTLHFWDITDHVAVEFDASGSYDPNGDDITFHWDFDGDDNYDESPDDDYEGGDPVHPIRDYYEDGIVQLKVIDEYGAEAICTEDVDVTEHQSKNIPLREEPWIARDIAVNPSNGELHVLYYWQENSTTNWTEVDLLSPCDLYTNPDEPFHVANEGAKYFRNDVNYNGYSMIGGGHDGCSGKVRTITPEGVDIGPNWVIHTVDLFAFNDADQYSYDHVTLYGWYSPPWNVQGHNTYAYLNPEDTTYGDWIQAAKVYWGTEIYYGYDRIYGNHIRGVDPVAYGNEFWVLKDPGTDPSDDYWGTLWSWDNGGVYTGISWSGEWFGIGTQTEADDGWYDARDFTRDSEDNLLVLDELSDGTGRIKAFVGDSSGGYPVDAMDIPDEINNTPIRIDSSDYIDPLYGNLLYVLHGDDSDWYYLSVYFEDETPW